MSWPQLPKISNVFRQSYITGFLDVSSIIIGRSDASLNGNVYISGNSTLVGDVSMNGNLKVGKSIYENGHSLITKYATLESPTFTGTTALPHATANDLYVSGDASFNSNVYVSGDVSLNGDVTVNTQSVSNNSNLVATTAYVKQQGYSTLTGIETLTNKTITMTGPLTLDNTGIVTAGSGDLNLAPSGSGIVHIKSNLTVDGSINFIGKFIQTDTLVTLTEQFDISNNGTGPALIVSQNGANDIAKFMDDSKTAMIIKDGGNVGIGKVFPNALLDVSGTAQFDGDSSFNARLFIAGDVSMNGNVRVTTQSVSNNSTLVATTAYVKNQSYLTTGTAAATYATIVNSTLTGVTRAENMAVSSDVSLNSRLYVHGSTVLDGDVSLNSNLYIYGNIIPSVGHVFSLGSAEKPFKSLYVDQNAINFVSSTSTVGISVNAYGGLDISNSTTGVRSTTVVSTNGNVIVGNLSVGKTTDPLVQLDVSGKSIFSSDVSMNNNLQVVNNAYLNNANITSASIGSLTATNDANLNKRLIVTGDASLNSRLYVASGLTVVSGTTTLQATTLSGLVTNSGGISGTGAISTSGGLTVSAGTTTLQATTLSGLVTNSGGISGTGAIATSGGLTVSAGTTSLQATTVAGTLTNSGGLTGSGAIATSGGLTVSAGTTSLQATTIAGVLTIPGGISGAGAISTSGGLTVSAGTTSLQATTLAGAVTNTGGISGAGAIATSGGLTVSAGTTSLQSTTVASGLTVSTGTTSIQGLISASDSSFNNRLYVGGSTALVGDVSLNRRLKVAGDVSMNGRLQVYGSSILSNVNLSASAPVNLTLGNSFVTNTGSITLSANASGSIVTLPQTGTLATLAGTETLTNKTLGSAGQSTNVLGNLVLDPATNITSTGSITMAPYNGNGNGNVHITGDLIVDGSTNILGKITQTNVLISVSEELDISASFANPVLRAFQYGSGDIAQFSLGAINGNTAVIGQNGLAVGLGVTTASYPLDVSGFSRFNGDVSLNQRVFISGDASLNSRLYVASLITSAGGLTVSAGTTTLQSTTLSGAVTNTGGISGTGAIATSGGLTVSAGSTSLQATTVAGALTNSGGISGSGAIATSGGLTVSAGTTSLQATTLSGAVTNTGGISGTGAIATSGGLTVSSGTTSLQATTVAGALTNSGGISGSGAIATSGGLTVSAGTTSLQDTTVSGLLTNTGGITGSNGLAVTSGQTSLYGDASLYSRLLVAGNVGIGTNSPQAPLHIFGGMITTGDAFPKKIYSYNSGAVSLSSATPAFVMTFNNTSAYFGNITAMLVEQTVSSQNVSVLVFDLQGGAGTGSATNSIAIGSFSRKGATNSTTYAWSTTYNTTATTVSLYTSNASTSSYIATFYVELFCGPNSNNSTLVSITPNGGSAKTFNY